MKQLMIEEKRRLSALITDINNRLKTLPQGTFFTTKNGRFVKWFCYKDGKKSPIHKSEYLFAHSLAQGTFLRLQLKEASIEYEAVKAYLRNAVAAEDTVSAYLDSHENFRKIILENQLGSYHSNEIIQNWLSSPYPKPKNEYKGTTYKTLKGDLVKSEAEKEIANALFLRNIPYRYECGITFDNGRTYFFPDFTIMDPATGTIYLWEHFGMAELNYYQHKNSNKLYVYFENGFVPGLNLICTASTDKVKLSKAQIEKTINYYFCL